MTKDDIFFTLICLFVIKLILLPAFLADAAVLLCLLAYKPVNNLINIKKHAVISEDLESKFQKLHKEIKTLDETVQSFKTKEQIVNTFTNTIKK